MNDLSFTKLTADGNDFILIDNYPSDIFNNEKLPVFLKYICNRKLGIGADGIIFLKQKDKTKAVMKIFNSDGSRAEMCGNALRCIGCYWENIIQKFDKIDIETDAGLKTVEKIAGMFKVNLGYVHIISVDNLMKFNNEIVLGTKVSAGNPHLVIDNRKNIFNIMDIGSFFEQHPDFPEGTNVELVIPHSNDLLQVRVWERGVGISLSCGTGAAAVFYTYINKNQCNNPCTIRLDGGDLLYQKELDGTISFTGNSILVFQGTLKITEEYLIANTY